MEYTIIPPPERLAAYVRYFWVLESEVPSHEPFVYRSMADGCAELIFHYCGTFDEIDKNDGIVKSFSGLHAQSQQYRRFVTQENFGIFGVYLYPYAIPKLCRISASEASNQEIHFDTVLGAAGKELEERMMLAPNNTARTAIISRFLEERLLTLSSADMALFSSIRHVVHAKEPVKVKHLAYQFNLSTRQLERKFKEYAGFSPKLYSRIIRFQSAIQEYGNKDISLTEIAYSCGYYDQSHFIHDFKTFSGYHPAQYFLGNRNDISYIDT